MLLNFFEIIINFSNQLNIQIIPLEHIN